MIRPLRFFLFSAAMLILAAPSSANASDDPKKLASETLMQLVYPDSVTMDKGEQAWMMMIAFAMDSIGPGSGITEEQYQKSHAELVSRVVTLAPARREILAPKFAERFSAAELASLTQSLSAPYYKKYQSQLPVIDHEYCDWMAHSGVDPAIDFSDSHFAAARAFLKRKILVQRGASADILASSGQPVDAPLEMISLYAAHFSEDELHSLTELFSSESFQSFEIKQTEIESDPETNRLLSLPILEAVKASIRSVAKQ